MTNISIFGHNSDCWRKFKFFAYFRETILNSAFRDVDLSDEYNRRLYSTRCGYRVEYTDANDNTIICIVSLSDCAMEISDVPLETIQDFRGKNRPNFGPEV